MSKIKVKGHDSGTGVITIEAPNTSTDRTITLPDSTGTLATTADTFNPDGAVTINDTGADVDFRVESDTDANALFVQGSSGKVGFGLEPSMGQVNIKTSGTFTTAFTDANGTAISMYSDDTAGDGKYGAAITWGALGGVNSHQAALTSIQTGSDANQVGLAMLTHNSTTGSAAMTEQFRITHDGRGLSQFTAKAWVNYDQKDTVSVRDSHNVNSVTDSGTGQHQVNFSNAMANANYVVMCTVNASGSGAKGFVMNEQNNNTTGLARNITYIDGTMTDLDTTHTIVFGD